VFWIGGLVGAFFGLAGIFVAACLYLFYALVKLVFLLATFVAQLIFAISGLIARAIIYSYHLIRSRNTASPTDIALAKRRVPAGLKPTRVPRRRKSTASKRKADAS
jgi:hypothetical protein